MKNYLKGLDWPLVIEVLLLTLIGLFVVYSATSRNADISQLWKRQLVGFFIALFAMWLFSRIDYRFWIEASYIFYWLSIFALVIVFFWGGSTNGAQRWIRLGILSFQPSELAKFSLILFLARYIGSRNVELFYLRRLFFLLVALGVPLVLILKQPDLGSALLLVPV
ncbi:MAG TPA: FtsW/RodA/SpoVE family cell cycle protein, partial [bacterium]|nr:FtsW/RodA/SpoVE family cell cycle protein [bacterium]